MLPNVKRFALRQGHDKRRNQIMQAYSVCLMNAVIDSAYFRWRWPSKVSFKHCLTWEIFSVQSIFIILIFAVQNSRKMHFECHLSQLIGLIFKPIEALKKQPRFHKKMSFVGRHFVLQRLRLNLDILVFYETEYDIYVRKVLFVAKLFKQFFLKKPNHCKFTVFFKIILLIMSPIVLRALRLR